jgi:DNA-binding transcriptional regulator YbjK
MNSGSMVNSDSKYKRFTVSILGTAPATISAVARRRSEFAATVEGRTTFETAIRDREEDFMARYGKAAGKSVKSALHREKSGTLRSGKGGKGGPVTTRKQAIAIGLSEARKKGAKGPPKK